MALHGHVNTTRRGRRKASNRKIINEEVVPEVPISRGLLPARSGAVDRGREPQRRPEGETGRREPNKREAPGRFHPNIEEAARRIKKNLGKKRRKGKK